MDMKETEATRWLQHYWSDLVREEFNRTGTPVPEPAPGVNQRSMKILFAAILSISMTATLLLFLPLPRPAPVHFGPAAAKTDGEYIHSVLLAASDSLRSPSSDTTKGETP